MATINDLISQIENVELRERIQKEVDALSRQKKFGLVFEDHIPECTLLYDVPVQRGRMVAIKGQDADVQYFVAGIKDGVARCINKATSEASDIPVEKLVCVAQFGDPIYPYLKPIDAVCNAADSDLWHTLIEADNYHALQLLEYLYAGKVDCIYIDPPYNTGAKDWKYNNDYVDGNDTYRHSKWLSMMEKRLKLAKKLLNPQDSVLIVTAMLLDTLKSKQDGGFYSVVEIRWCAIQAFFMGDVDACIRKLEEALETAKKTDLPGWVIKDILIDLRNMEIERSNIINTYSEPGAQAELSNSKEEVYYPKMDAISILMCISQIYTSDYLRNQDVYAELYSKRNDIKAADVSILSNNIDDVALKIALCLSFSVTGHDMTCELMEHMSLLQNDKATTLAVTRFIAEYLELTDTVLLPEKIEDLIMTNVLVWLHSEYIDIRWNAMRILLSMSRSEKYATLVNHQLLQAIDTQSAYIKNLIMRRIYKLKGVTKQTREYVMKKCEKDASFVVRMVCNEIKEGNDNE